MSVIKEKAKFILFILASTLGLSALVALSAQQPLSALLERAEANVLDTAMLAEGESCAPYSQNYMQLLHEQSDAEVYIAGCGGVF